MGQMMQSTMTKMTRMSGSRVNVPALVITLVIAVVGPLFVASYGLAMGDPSPRDVPVGTVGDAAQARSIDAALDAGGADTFRTVRFDSSAAAADALAAQQIYAVIEPDAGSLVVSSASGASVARVVEAAQPALSQALGVSLTVSDAHPLATRDPSGLVLFYLALGATILGFVGAIQTRVNAGGMTLRAEVGWDLARSAIVALLMTLAIGPVLGLEQLPVVPVWLVLTATMFVAAMAYSFWRVVIGGKWALLPTWIMFVIVASPSSGGAVGPAAAAALLRGHGALAAHGRDGARAARPDLLLRPPGDRTLSRAGWLGRDQRDGVHRRAAPPVRQRSGPGTRTIAHPDRKGTRR